MIDKSDGRISYRWGNPYNYGEGRAPSGYYDDGDQQLWGPHAPDWTMDNTITILDNGDNRPSGPYTRAVELDPATGQIVWSFGGIDLSYFVTQFYSSNQSGAQKLENGNWMITTSAYSHLVEVTPDKRVVWEFVNPVSRDQIYQVSNARGSVGDPIHKASRYPANYPGFVGKDMTITGSMPNWLEILSGASTPMN